MTSWSISEFGIAGDVLKQIFCRSTKILRNWLSTYLHFANPLETGGGRRFRQKKLSKKELSTNKVYDHFLGKLSKNLTR